MSDSLATIPIEAGREDMAPIEGGQFETFMGLEAGAEAEPPAEGDLNGRVIKPEEAKPEPWKEEIEALKAELHETKSQLSRYEQPRPQPQQPQANPEEQIFAQRYQEEVNELTLLYGDTHSPEQIDQMAQNRAYRETRRDMAIINQEQRYRQELERRFDPGYQTVQTLGSHIPGVGEALHRGDAYGAVQAMLEAASRYQLPAPQPPPVQQRQVNKMMGGYGGQSQGRMPMAGIDEASMKAHFDRLGISSPQAQQVWMERHRQNQLSR